MIHSAKISHMNKYETFDGVFFRFELVSLAAASFADTFLSNFDLDGVRHLPLKSINTTLC